MRTVLVTGDNGLVGCHVVSALKKKVRVIGLSRTHEKNLDYETIDFDLTKDVTPSISDIDTIIHLAADTECKDEKSAFKTNVIGTEKILKLAKRNNVKSFIYASTGGIYGFKENKLKETDKPNPHNTYSETKYIGECLCKEYAKYFPITILRYFFPYGAASNNLRLINRLIAKVKNGEAIELNVYGKPIINPVFIEDVVDATIKAIKTKSNFNIFNISGDEEVTILQLVKIVESVLHTTANIVFNNNVSKNMIGDNSKAKKILGWKPKTRLEDGIKKLVKQQDSTCLQESPRRSKT